MKQILYIPMMVLLLLAAGCQRSSVEGIPGESVTAVFRVSLPSDMPTKAISDGAGATELLFKAYAVKVLYSICQQIWKTPAAATGLEKVSFHSNPKERQCQRMLRLPHNCTHLTC